MNNAHGVWTPEYNKSGELYTFCWCGLVVWDIVSSCSRGHKHGSQRLNRPTKRKARGYSKQRTEEGQFQGYFE